MNNERVCVCVCVCVCVAITNCDVINNLLGIHVDGRLVAKSSSGSHVRWVTSPPSAVRKRAACAGGMLHESRTDR